MAKKTRIEPLATVCANNNVEVFYVDAATARANRMHEKEESAAPRYTGWYYWTCMPGCLPDSDAYGPFTTAYKACEDAIETFGLTRSL